VSTKHKEAPVTVAVFFVPPLEKSVLVIPYIVLASIIEFWYIPVGLDIDGVFKLTSQTEPSVFEVAGISLIADEVAGHVEQVDRRLIDEIIRVTLVREGVMLVDREPAGVWIDGSERGVLLAPVSVKDAARKLAGRERYYLRFGSIELSAGDGRCWFRCGNALLAMSTEY